MKKDQIELLEIKNIKVKEGLNSNLETTITKIREQKTSEEMNQDIEY